MAKEDNQVYPLTGRLQEQGELKGDFKLDN